MKSDPEIVTYKVTLHPALEKLLQQKTPKKTGNYKRDELQTVFPIKRKESIIAMANWLMENKSKKYVLAFILGINLGLRANELLSLRMNQLFWPDGSVRLIDEIEDTSDAIDIYQSKTKKHRVVFLNAACKEALEWFFPVRGVWLHSDAFVFPSREGGAIQVGTLRKVIKEAAAACGIRQNVGTHTLRKTWGWWEYKHNCSDKNLDLSMLQRAFGHSSQEVTLRYLNVTDEENKALYHGMCLRVTSDPDFAGNAGRGQGDCPIG